MVYDKVETWIRQHTRLLWLHLVERYSLSRSSAWRELYFQHKSESEHTRNHYVGFKVAIDRSPGFLAISVFSRKHSAKPPHEFQPCVLSTGQDKPSVIKFESLYFSIWFTWRS